LKSLKSLKSVKSLKSPSAGRDTLDAEWTQAVVSDGAAEILESGGHEEVRATL
jgi:hypothetical protein